MHALCRLDALLKRYVAYSCYKAPAKSLEKHTLIKVSGSPNAKRRCISYAYSAAHALRSALSIAMPLACQSAGTSHCVSYFSISARLLRRAGRAAHWHAARLASGALDPDRTARIDIAVAHQRSLSIVAAHAVRIPKLYTAFHL